MPTDKFYTIGSSHLDCQDYVVSTNKSIVLADGCSSAVTSGLGARVLAHSVEALKPRDQSGWAAVRQNVSTIIGRLNVNSDAWCATLLWLEHLEDEKAVELQMCGDGCFIVRNKTSQELEVYSLWFPSGAPYYLWYEDGIKQQYLEQFGDSYILTGPQSPQQGSYIWDYPDGILKRRFSTDTYDLFAVSSDGIASFGLSSVDVAEQLLAFKGYAGQFVARRAKVALSELAKQGYVPYDDFSLGVMYIP